MKKNLKLILNEFKITLFCLMPLHLISKITFSLSRLENSFIKNLLIKSYMAFFKIDLRQYKKKSISDYDNLNDFFIRELDLNFRKDISDENNIISPCDGTISGFGEINDNTFIHAKRHKYNIDELLDEKNDSFSNGKFINIYLEPADCHRIYIPYDSNLLNMKHISGSLYSVAPYASFGIKQLYSKNERVVLNFKCESFLMTIIMIGAVNVGCISLTRHGIVMPAKYKTSSKNISGIENYNNYKKGEEVAMFNLGSTVIVLIGEIKKSQWCDNINVGQKILIRDDILKIN